jgi:hypothetical protein
LGQEFLDDLKAEYADLWRRRGPAPAEPAGPAWEIALDSQVKALEVYFYQGKMPGWIDVNLSVDGIQHTLHATGALPPFDDMIDFLIGVAEGRLPCNWSVEEEGPEKLLYALPWPADPECFHFKLVDWGYPHYTLLMTHIFNRRQFVLAFYNDMLSFLETHYDPLVWGLPNLFQPEKWQALRALVEG